MYMVSDLRMYASIAKLNRRAFLKAMGLTTGSLMLPNTRIADDRPVFIADGCMAYVYGAASAEKI